METEILVVDPQVPQPELIRAAAELIQRGGLVAFPTETVYGLGANALDQAAVAQIFLAKGRPSHNPLIVHVAQTSAVYQVAAAVSPLALELAARFWPGPLTLVLPRGEAIPDLVTGGGATVAVRIPAHPVAQALLRAAGLPIAAPSANRSTQLSPTRAEHVLRGLGGRIPLLLDGGPTPGGIESTVLDVTTDPPRLLRPGLVSVADLEAVIGPVSLSSVVDSGTTALPSPGLAARHYAPRTPLECVPDGFTYAQDLAGQGQRVGLVLLGKAPAGPPHPGLIVVELPDHPEGYAAGLFAALHALDDCQLQRIVVASPPDTPAWMGVRDRLRRAVHFPKTPMTQ